MEVLSIELGRAVQLVVADEVRSSSGMPLAEATRLLTQRYEFAIPPDIADAQAGGLKYKEGHLVIGNKTINIKELGVFSDGVSADTYSTLDSDLLIDDVIAWSQHTLGLRKARTVIGRKYVSHIVAVLDQKVNDSMEAFRKMGDASAAALKAAYGVNVPIGLSGASWGSDLPPSPDTFLSAEFNFYRRLKRPYSENRFFFIAPVPTDIHIQWIEKLENALLGR